MSLSVWLGTLLAFADGSRRWRVGGLLASLIGAKLERALVDYGAQRLSIEQNSDLVVFGDRDQLNDGASGFSRCRRRSWQVPLSGGR
jgi:hypothetical protein